MTDVVKFCARSQNSRQQWMLSDNLPQLPQPDSKKLGQPQPNKHAMPQLPQSAPAIFNVYRMENRHAACVMCGQRIKFAPQKSGCELREYSTAWDQGP